MVGTVCNGRDLRGEACEGPKHVGYLKGKVSLGVVIHFIIIEVGLGLQVDGIRVGETGQKNKLTN